MDSKDCRTLYDFHVECLASFNNLITTINSLTSTSIEYQQMGMEFQEDLYKYKLWAFDVGASNTTEQRTLSLDFRLQEVAYLRSQVIRLLESLMKTVMKAQYLLDGTKIPFELSSPNTTLPENTEPFDTEASEDDSPWEISDDSNDSGCEADSPQDMHRNDHSQNDNRNSNERPTTEMGQVLKSTKLIIECLYKLPLRNPAPIDRIKRFRDPDTSPYEAFDVMHVREKFPNADAYLVDRLGKLISHRRQLLEHRVTQTEELRLPTFPKGTFQSPAEGARNLQELDHAPVTESKLSTESEDTEEHELEVPTRPFNESGEPLVQFDCPYCGLAQCIPLEPSRDWESHVLLDLQPYVCTFQDCDMFDHMFESRQAWFTHELELHRANWSCNTCPSEPGMDSPHLTFGNKDAFMSHMSSVHQLSKPRLNNLTGAFRHPSSKVDGYCCLCGKHVQKLELHLGRHMEDVALFALQQPSLPDSSNLGNSTKVLIDQFHGSSRNLPSKSNPENRSGSGHATGNDTAGHANATSSPFIAVAAWRSGVVKPRNPDPSSDRGLTGIANARNSDTFPNTVWDMLPSDALSILVRNVESIMSVTRTEPAPSAPTSTILPLSLLVLEKAETYRDFTIPESSTKGRTIPARFIQGSSRGLKDEDYGESVSPSHPVTERVLGTEPTDSIALPKLQQQRAMLRKFYSKNIPPITIKLYLERLYQFCPMSTAVYLATSLRLRRLAVEQQVVTINAFTAYRLVLAGLLVQAKALEDVQYPHAKLAKVGGVSEAELLRLEISFCFLAKFDFFVDMPMLQSHYDSFMNKTKTRVVEDLDKGKVTQRGIVESRGMAEVN
ncbi:hypothetical protein SNK03_009198 [Fusarium graminearum]